MGIMRKVSATVVGTRAVDCLQAMDMLQSVSILSIRVHGDHHTAVSAMHMSMTL